MNHTIILCGGKGNRMGAGVNKVLLVLENKPVIYYAIKPFEDSELIDTITVVANENDIGHIRECIGKYRFKKVVNIVEGGRKRQDSVHNGLISLNAKDNDIVFIHNGANPFADKEIIKKMLNETHNISACICGFPVENTIKEINKGNIVNRTLKREMLWEIQTPQSAKYWLLKKAYEKAYEDKFCGTDDSGLIERIGYKVKVVRCGRENFKLTTQTDFDNAVLIMNSLRVGIGIDSHRFGYDGNQLILGGVIIPDIEGLSANSDGDVILHAITNALSSSIGGRSLGVYADELCKKGVKDSKEYLKIILQKIKEKNYSISNLGISIECKRPRISDYEEKIKDSVANILGIKSDDVGINTTSGEELTEFGKGKGIYVIAVVGLRKE